MLYLRAELIVGQGKSLAVEYNPDKIFESSEKLIA